MDNQRNVIHGAGNMNIGTFSDSQVISQAGIANTAGSQVRPPVGQPDRLLEELATELAGIRLRLERLAATADRDDALEAVGGLAADLPSLAGHPEVGKRLRQRLKALLGALDPVVKLIGGVAGLQQILGHL